MEGSWRNGEELEIMEWSWGGWREPGEDAGDLEMMEASLKRRKSCRGLKEVGEGVRRKLEKLEES